MLTCPYDLSQHCLGTREEVDANEGRYLYRHYKRGNSLKKLLEKQRSGEMNIVIGGQGEHEVNVLWSIKEAYRNLAKVCEICGGLVSKNSTAIQLSKPYGGIWIINYRDGKLRNISQNNVWWSIVN